jgi:dipeptidyl aminopeptidase/acylaminoacyl peptidase
MTGAASTTLASDERAGAAPSGRRTALALVVAGVVVVGTIVGIVVAGHVPLPAMPSLADAPDPSVPGTIAFARGDWEAACLATVPAGGGDVTSLRCSSRMPEALAWTIDGDLAVTMWDEPSPFDEGPQLTIVDPATGEDVDRPLVREPVDWASDRRVRDEDGARLVVVPNGDGEISLRVRLADGTTTDLAHLTGPRDYGIVSVQWSPDGAWVLAMDTRGRLFLVGADGTPGPRLLVDAGGREAPVVLPAWWIDGVTAQRVDAGT